VTGVHWRAAGASTARGAAFLIYKSSIKEFCKYDYKTLHKLRLGGTSSRFAALPLEHMFLQCWRTSLFSAECG